MAAKINDDDDFDDIICQAADAFLPTAITKTVTPKTDEIQIDDFGFPFTPYSIQLNFMQHLFSAINSGKMGIFESPTGTGKSLSLICGALTWLQSDERRREQEFDELSKEQNFSGDKNSDDDDDWIREFAEKEEIKSKNQPVLEKYRRLREREIALRDLKRNFANARSRGVTRKRKFNIEDEENFALSTKISPVKIEDGKLDEDDVDSELLLEDYDSDTEQKNAPSSSTKIKEDEEIVIDTPKIIYCSRTHSQLAQFLNELRKTWFADAIRCVTLGSRQTFCVNETVRRLEQLNLINERCLDLQRDKRKNDKKTKSKKTVGCPYYKHGNVETFADSILVEELRDVENLIADGKERQACPYYAGRKAVSAAQLVLAPYQILLHEATRDACGLRMDGNVIIVDEAHNLLDAISAVHSCEIDTVQLENSWQLIERYAQRFGRRLNAKNLMYIRQLGNVLDGLSKALKKCPEEKVYALNEFIFYAEIDTVNIFKLLTYIENSKIADKTHSFALKMASEKIAISKNSSIGSPLHAVESFLRCLVQRCEDGRIVIAPASCNTAQIRRAKMKFVHLNPAVFFADICQRAKSIILAGGTMEPVDDLIDQLFTPCGVSTERIERFTCGHIVPDENLAPLVLDKGPSGVQFDFTYAHRNDESIIRDLGRLLVNLSNIVPGGVICFFASYEYESAVFEAWTRLGIVKMIEQKKRIFREPSRASDVRSVLDDFAKNVSEKGALLLAVVGGKLSEGINFADDLGRLVVMIGLPYPNFNSVELKEKMRMLNAGANDETKGRRYYENLCAKALNQSIGRVIRHGNDYATILLLDKNYAKASTLNKLPLWIKKSVKINDSFGTCFATIKSFFNVMTKKYS